MVHLVVIQIISKSSVLSVVLLIIHFPKHLSSPVEKINTNKVQPLPFVGLDPGSSFCSL